MTETRDLKPNGRDISVIEENEMAYISFRIPDENDCRHSEAASVLSSRNATSFSNV